MQRKNERTRSRAPLLRPVFPPESASRQRARPRTCLPPATSRQSPGSAARAQHEQQRSMPAKYCVVCSPKAVGSKDAWTPWAPAKLHRVAAGECSSSTRAFHPNRLNRVARRQQGRGVRVLITNSSPAILRRNRQRNRFRRTGATAAGIPGGLRTHMYIVFYRPIAMKFLLILFYVFYFLFLSPNQKLTNKTVG